jgi:hypothetical protein
MSRTKNEYNIENEQDYILLMKSGMMFVFHPELTGEWNVDKITILGEKSEERMKVIGQNGNDGLHYSENSNIDHCTDALHYVNNVTLKGEYVIRGYVKDGDSAGGYVKDTSSGDTVYAPHLLGNVPNVDFAKLCNRDEPIIGTKDDANSEIVTKAQDRKATPVFMGVLKYFPNALKEVAKCSKAGNDQHHPDKPLHWDMDKSKDELDALTRHLIDHGVDPIDDDGVLHLAKVAWRALAALERHLTDKH